MVVTCKNEDDQNKNEGTRVLTTFPPFNSMGTFSDGQGQLTPQSVVESGQIKCKSKFLKEQRKHSKEDYGPDCTVSNT